MSSMTAVSLVCILCFVICTTIVHGQTTERPTRFMEEDDLILFNVAVKGRVVELLANEIARTEIIRALLYEYAKECVQNITVLEKSCLNCMTERCENRLAHCNIKDINLSEVLNHKPSPIQGLQFLSNAPKKVTAELKDFADNARADILRDVPDKLRGKGEKIVHSEVDESLSELKDNINTEKTLQRITIHFQKATNNVHLLPELGEKLATLIVENGDRAVNVAELLANRLRGARPYIDSMQHNGQKVKAQAPGILTRFGNTVSAFKDRVVGVFNTALDTFQQALADPDTTLVQGSQQFNMVPGQQFPQQMGNQVPMQVLVAGGQPVRSQFRSDFGPIINRPFTMQDRNEVHQILRGLELQVQNQLQGLQGLQQSQMNAQQFLQQNPQMQHIPNRQKGQSMQGQGIQQGSLSQNLQTRPFSGQMPVNGQILPPGNQDQGQITGQIQPSPIQENNHLGPTQFPQNQQPMQQNIPPTGPQSQSIPLQPNGQMSQGQPFQANPTPQGQMVNNQIASRQNFATAPMSNQNIPVQPTVQGQPQMRMIPGRQGQLIPQGRRRRQIEPGCDKLRYDPETYCKTYESQCHNCTLEKRLRFEVCGEGVDKARDEIKRLDNSVRDYLEAYDDHVSDGPLVLKVELNDTNRLSKTNTYYDAFITAKIGAAIIRYKTKMILNVNDLHVSGSQIGDEIWEKLWEQNVFSEAQRLDIVQNHQHDMGQLHKFDVDIKSKIDSKNGHRKTQAQKSSAGIVFTTMTSVFLSVVCLAAFVV